MSTKETRASVRAALTSNIGWELAKAFPLYGDQYANRCDFRLAVSELIDDGWRRTKYERLNVRSFPRFVDECRRAYRDSLDLIRRTTRGRA